MKWGSLGSSLLPALWLAGTSVSRAVNPSPFSSSKSTTSALLLTMPFSNALGGPGPATDLRSLQDPQMFARLPRSCALIQNSPGLLQLGSPLPSLQTGWNKRAPGVERWLRVRDCLALSCRQRFHSDEELPPMHATSIGLARARSGFSSRRFRRTGGADSPAYPRTPAFSATHPPGLNRGALLNAPNPPRSCPNTPRGSFLSEP